MRIERFLALEGRLLLMSRPQISTQLSHGGTWTGVLVRSNRGHLAHVLRMQKYQRTLQRLRMAGNPLSDFLYITNRVWMGTPSARLQVRPPHDASPIGKVAAN